MRRCPRLFRAIPVAIEAVDLHARIAVATGAKMLLAGDARIVTVCIRSHMTIDTTVETMLFGADTPMGGFIPLMKDEYHVVTPHDVGWLHALFTLGLRDRRNLGIGNAIAGTQGQDDARRAHKHTY